MSDRCNHPDCMTIRSIRAGVGRRASMYPTGVAVHLDGSVTFSEANRFNRIVGLAGRTFRPVRYSRGKTDGWVETTGYGPRYSGFRALVKTHAERVPNTTRGWLTMTGPRGWIVTTFGGDDRGCFREFR